ncbi:MAG: ATP-dependent RNA helicase DbpA [Pseudohongiellaceae bacterium]
MSSTDFQSLQLRSELPQAISALNYKIMTPIQEQALPVMLAGHDVLAQANTGSGKTAAFTIALLNKLDEKLYETQSLIICPTRELADQVSEEIRRLARTIGNVKVLTLCGGKPLGPQLASLQRAPHIVVGTPGRLLKLLQKKSLTLDSAQTLVLDEADRMLDMGFSEDITEIISYVPKDRQTLLFSATYPDEIQAISGHIQRNPKDVRVTASEASVHIAQKFFKVRKSERVQAFIQIVQHFQPESTLVFCNTIEQCQRLAGELVKKGLHALALHGDLEQFKRDQVLVRFSNRSSSVLIATDVAARGLDIDELDMVVNFELARDAEVHVHRIGRTGRAGSEGLALSLFSEEEEHKVQNIQDYQKVKIERASPADLVVKQTQTKNTVPVMTTILISAGRKDKLRPGDIVGALTSNPEMSGDCIGKINVFDKVSYVAINSTRAALAATILAEGKIKGRNFRVKQLR